MTIIKLKGGLGNQLFQYAYGRLVALKRQEELKLDRDIMTGQSDTYRAYGLDNFNIKASIATPDEVRAAKYPYGLISKAWRLVKAKVFKVYHIGFEASALKTKATYLDGYYQSTKYLDPIRKELLAEISPKIDLSFRYGFLFLEMATLPSVAVHIRRGDYVSDAKTRKAHFICDLAYYEKAMTIMKEKVTDPVFYIFSDDIAWAKENLKGEERLVFVSGPEMKDYEEMILMSSCEHNIIANSSFSFWSAWLNRNDKKIVIAPSLWNRKFKKEYRDMLPSDWVKI